jgi:hypothetical protein
VQSSLTLCLLFVIVLLLPVVCLYVIYKQYAPDAPWDTAETLDIFQQVIRQLANLAHTTSPSQQNYDHYLRILELLAQVKIGIVLVDLTKPRVLLDDSGLQDDDDANGEHGPDEALRVLAELLRTILQSVRLDHPPQIPELAQKTISACLEEYDNGIMVPIPLLDELLVCIGQGRTVLVTNPAAAAAAAAAEGGRKKKLPLHQVEQVNPSYVVAASVVRHLVDRLGTPVANLLNGLLNGDAHIVGESSISVEPLASCANNYGKPRAQNQTADADVDVWSIIYELHKIAPPILTTVVGTVSNSLQDTQLEKRLLVTKLFGRLFTSTNSTMAEQFGPVYRSWLVRANDREVDVRMVMVEYLIKIISNTTSSFSLDVREQAQKALLDKIHPTQTTTLHNSNNASGGGAGGDPDPDVNLRLKVVHEICDLAYSNKAAISAQLLHGVQHRLASKHKQERRDALTGLAQTHHRQFTVERLQEIQAGGDDCDLEVIVRVMHAARNDDDNGCYRWIPSKVFECMCYSDAIDTEMHSRVCLVVDDLLLGSELTNSSKRMTPTARAVGLALVVDSLEADTTAILTGGATSTPYQWMITMFQRRAQLQSAVSQYIDSRSQVRLYERGSEKELTANAKAEELLERVASLTGPPQGNAPEGERHPVLEKFHAAKDKHIFRILSTIATPTHSTAARIRALEELPKRVKHLGEATVAWVRTLVRRCAMGDFMNSQNVQHCIQLALECFQAEELQLSASLVACVKVAADCFPELCATKECFGTLIEFFTECRGLPSGKFKKEVEQSGMVTALSAILAAAAPASITVRLMKASLLIFILRSLQPVV